MRQYAINLRDKRVVLCTKETLENVDYHPITKELANAIETDVISAEEVIAKIKGKLISSSADWDALLKQKKSQNMRHSDITKDTIESLETIIKPEEVKGEVGLADIMPKEEVVSEPPKEEPKEASQETEQPKRGRPAKAQ